MHALDLAIVLSFAGYAVWAGFAPRRSASQWLGRSSWPVAA